ncbi:DUF3107 domain-containing protein [Ornithinicoccus halotolerans]|uniref:DUF3107 domain-containing protein n=1 Tax=Ornithinicoccus halotolerans TaxID=1748220 RepID=UPI00129683DD|nr:DUF3107 domain-containing protein [Ornithinicoccus halotolerans]
MQIRIGVRDVATEVLVETEEDVEQVLQRVRAALTGDQPTLELPDDRGGQVVVPTAALGYVQVVGEKGRVGFGRP